MAGTHDPMPTTVGTDTGNSSNGGSVNDGTKPSTRFQQWLRHYLREHGMTNVQAGEKFGVNDSLIGHYLRGTRAPTYTTLQKIRDATSIDMNTLFD